ncbi:MAG TPA: hypothetical protein PKY56_12520 [Candidatus Kapabacteria bacterium]|nr:hypothetical protein [Candidatus Kapabacteria bacterium]
MEFKTKEYPKGNEVVINEIMINYSQESELSEEDNNLKLSICHQGAGFYFVMETTRWTFDNISQLDQVLADFKAKANVV